MGRAMGDPVGGDSRRIGAGVGAVLLGMAGDDEEPEQRAAPAREDPLLVGFMDDVSFRWHPQRALKLDQAKATGARMIRALVHWNVVAPKRPRPARLPFQEPLLFEVDELVATPRRAE